jgi:hypothetical protein
MDQPHEAARASDPSASGVASAAGTDSSALCHVKIRAVVAPNAQGVPPPDRAPPVDPGAQEAASILSPRPRASLPGLGGAGARPATTPTRRRRRGGERPARTWPRRRRPRDTRGGRAHLGRLDEGVQRIAAIACPRGDFQAEVVISTAVRAMDGAAGQQRTIRRRPGVEIGPAVEGAPLVASGAMYRACR